VVGRAVYRPPYGAARSFAEWAIDLWPYVNGKAVASRLDLTSLNAADLIDVLHYYFEEDANLATGEQMEARDKMRSSIYGELYMRTYRYGASSSSTTDFSALDDPYGDDMPVPVDPMAKSFSAVKPFVPATEINEGSSKPFGRLLDAPLG
jgi:hypothetical protein